MSDRLALNALLRTDLPSFIHKCFRELEPGSPFSPNWHIDHIAWNLTRVSAGEINRLIINIPPRHLKSICTTVAYTAWVLGHDPSRRIITVSYANELARKHADDFRKIVESPWYREIFPNFQISRRGNRQMEIVTTTGGFRYAGSIDGSILGRGADLIVIDDPLKAQDALSKMERQHLKTFYDNTLYTRLNDKAHGAIVLVMQRLHADDLVAHVLDKEDWEVVAIPAIETENRAYRTGIGPRALYTRRTGEAILSDREDLVLLDQIRRTIGSMNFAAQYQQTPIPPDGNVIRREWLRYYDTTPAFELVVASWDTASTLGEDSDYSVGTVWGIVGQTSYLIDVVRGRLEVPALRKRIEALSLHHQAHATLIEETDLGRAMVQEMRRGPGPLRPILCRPRFDKEARMLAQSPRFEAGEVVLPREAPWLATYLEEILGFPNVAHDDQVDSTSQALNWLSRKIAALRPRTQQASERRNTRRR